MKIFKKIVILLVCLTSQLMAQEVKYIDTSIFEVMDSVSGYYRLKEPGRAGVESVISVLKKMYGLSNADEFTLFNTIRDSKNNEHKKFIQIHNGISVMGGGVNIHLDAEGRVQYVNGYFANTFDLKAISINSEEAISKAIKSCEGKVKFKWQDSLSEKILKKDQNDDRATYFPKSELLYEMDIDRNIFVPVYKIPIQVTEITKSEFIYVSAIDGSIWRKHPLEIACGNGKEPLKVRKVKIKHSACSSDNQAGHGTFGTPTINIGTTKSANENPSQFHYSGTGSCGSINDCQSAWTTTKFYGTQGIKIGDITVGVQCPYMIGTGGYSDCWVRLHESCQSPVHTRMSSGDEIVSNNSVNFDSWILPTCLSFNGVNNAIFPTDERTQIHWVMEKTNEFYRDPTRFNRNGFDNNGIATISNTDDASTTMADNAMFNPVTNQITLGKKGAKGNFDPISSDILAHEYTHGVSKFSVSGGLIQSGESGALSESFSDIFGKMLEYYVKTNYSTGTSFNYIMGDEVFNNSTFSALFQVGTNLYSNYTLTSKRNMGNPNSTYNPDTYGGVNWINPLLNNNSNGDFGGIHSNCQVQNYWFYLLAEGGSGVNDLNNSYCVDGIGKDKAMRIAYHNLTTNLLSNASFNDARAGSILSAIVLYGANSNEVAQVTQAWYAVGVGANYTGSVDVKLHTAVAVENYHHNCKIQVYDFVDANPGGDVTITSNTEIAMLHDMDIKFGSIYNAYITPTCNGNSARYISPSPSVSTNSQTDSGSDLPLTKSVVNAVSSDPDISIIPNPSDGHFTLNLDRKMEYPKSISVLDVMGKVVNENTSPSSYEIKFDMNNTDRGIYIIRINYSDLIINKRIVIN